MQHQATPLKPLSTVSLTADEAKILAWLRKTVWEPQAGERDPIPYKTKVPEFFGGVRLFNMQGGSVSAHGALSLLIKKLEYQGVLTKQDLYPVVRSGTAHFLSLKKADLDNLGVGGDEDDDY